MPFDIHKYSTETLYGTVVFGLIFLFAAGAVVGIRPWWSGCITAMLICNLGIYAIFAHFDPQATSKTPSTQATQPAGVVPANLLVPANDSDPPNPMSKMVETTTAGRPHLLKVFLGTTMGFTTKDVQIVLEMGGKEIITIFRADEGISFNINLFDPNGIILAQIERNEFFVNERSAFRIKRPDPHTLIVFDQRAEKVLDVRYLNPSAVRILGIFNSAGCPCLAVSESAVTVNGRPWMIGCVAGDCGVLFGVAPISPSQSQPQKPIPSAFSAEIFSMVRPGTKRGDPTLFWIRGDVGAQSASPITLPIYLRLANRSQTPLVVDFYSVEVQAADGTWVKATLVPADRGKLYCAPNADLKAARDITLKGGWFDSVCKREPVLPGQFVQGWIMLNFPKVESDVIPLRLNVRDSIGYESTENIQIVKDVPAPPPGGFQISHPSDLSALPVKLYLDQTT